MGVAITLDPAAWKQQYPNFDYLSDTQVQLYFNQAAMVHRNDGGGPVCDAATQTNLLYLLTAHVATLLAPTSSGQAPNPTQVGRISQASEGSVNVSLELPGNMPQASAWFAQTQYGLMYWTATKPYRTMRYLPNPRNPVNAGIGLWAWPWPR